MNFVALFVSNIIILSYSNLKWLMTLLPIFIFTFITVFSTSNHFKLSLWKNFHMNSPTLLFSHTQSTVTIELISRRSLDYEGKYWYTEENLLIELQGDGKKIQVLSMGETIIVRGLEEHEKVILNREINKSRQSHIKIFKGESLGSINLLEQLQGKTVLAGLFDTFVFGTPENLSFKQIEAKFEQTRQKAEERVISWMKKRSISSGHSSFVAEMLSQTIGSICKENNHVGLCDFAHFGTKHARYEIDTRHSFLVLDLLYEEYSQTALYLFEQMIDLFENRLFYEQGHLPFVPIPEHLDFLRVYVKEARQNFEELNELSIRVKAVLNGFINQILLSDVNNLEEEINYRESQNVHPTLYKMLTMKWKATSAKRAVSSIYEESFTPDYFYNYPNQTIDTSVSKIAWLTNAVSQYSKLVNEIGDPLDRASFEQPVSLLNVVKRFMNSDSEAEQGRYFSINSIGGGVRIYDKQSGYESLLPFAYGLTEIFPEGHLKNITTKYGLASLSMDSPKVNEHYEYRSNIHSYFNYKLLFGLKKNLNKKNNQYRKVIDQVIQQVKTFLLEKWGRQESFTMWSVSGKGLRNKRQLAVVNVGFLGQAK